MRRARRDFTNADLSEYQYDPVRYIREKLGWEPWEGSEATPGQVEVINAYVLALRQQHERADFKKGLIAEADLKYWRPGEVIKNRIRIEAGHTVGKTKLASGLFNHFFDCFCPSIIYSYAPGWESIKDLLWKEIETDREGKGLPGRVLQTCEIKYKPNHFAKGRATNDSGGKGTERVQGQHGKYLMFVLDEAEGVADFVYGAVESMTSGGISIVLMLANPKSRGSLFHKQAGRSDTASFRISCVNHPNVLTDREIVPGAVQRDYVRKMVELLTEIVPEHDEDQQTFTLPFPVTVHGAERPGGTIFKPYPEFLWRVLGIAPSNVADNTFVPFGRYEAACKRAAPAEDRAQGRIGVDVAGFGKDYGTIYIRHNGRVWRFAQIWRQDYDDYARRVKQAALHLKSLGVTNIQIRIDAGGGFGNGVTSHLKLDSEFLEAFPEENRRVIMVHFGVPPHDKTAYADVITELYAEAAETLKGIRVDNPPEALEGDLTERTYDWVNKSGVSVKKLEEKKAFKKRKMRSPDDGDGFVLCAAPDHLFTSRKVVTFE